MAQKPARSRKSLLLRIFLFSFVIYAVVMLVDMQVTVASRRQELAELELRLETQRIANKELERQWEMGMDMEEIERRARGEGYVDPDERIFIDISGR